MSSTQTAADVAAAEHQHTEAVAEHGVDSPEARETEQALHAVLHGLTDIETGEEEVSI